MISSQSGFIHQSKTSKLQKSCIENIYVSHIHIEIFADAEGYMRKNDNFRKPPLVKANLFQTIM